MQNVERSMPAPKAGLAILTIMLLEGVMDVGGEEKGAAFRVTRPGQGCPGSPRCVSAGSATFSPLGSQMADPHAPGE